MSMSEPRRQACMKITRKLMKLPCARTFMYPVDPNGKTDYNDIIKYPIDLTTIYGHLVNKEYPRVEAWERDIVMLSYNCGAYFGHDSFPYILAQKLNEHYTKLRERYLIYTFPKWNTQLNILKTKIDKLIASPPSTTKNMFPSLQLPKEKSTQFKENEYISLLKCLQKLKSPADTLAFVNIFYKYEPQIPAYEDPLSVDLRTLKYDSLVELRKYAKRRCQELGIKYD